MSMKPSPKVLTLAAFLAVAAPVSAAASHPASAPPSPWEAAWQWIVELFAPVSGESAQNANCVTDSSGRTTCPANAVIDVDHGCTIDPEGHPTCH